MSSKKEKYDIFISYRRDGADQTAKAIYDKLTAKGYKVFYDVEALRAGAFNTELYKKIEECQDFILILPPNGLDRCIEEDDWVRLEIAYALKHKKNIIPVMLRGFEFPKQLPEEIEPIRVQNGLVADVTYFDAVIDKLCKFLKTKVNIIKRFMGKSITSKVIYSIAVVAILLAFFFGVESIVDKTIQLKIYPATQQEENDVKEMIYNIQTNISVVEILNSQMLRVLDASEEYINGSTIYTYDELIKLYDDAEKQIDYAMTKVIAIDGELKKNLKKNNIDVASLEVIPQYVNDYEYSYKDAVKFLRMEMDEQYGYTKDVQQKLIDLRRHTVEINSKIMILGVCDLLIPISEEASEDFLKIAMPEMQILSQYLYLWTDDKVSIEAQMNQLFEEQEGDLVEYAKLVGEGSKEVASLENTIEQQKNELIKKYSPEQGDTWDELWTKALVFLNAQMYDESIEVFEYYIGTIDDEYDPKSYVPYAINFVNQIKNTEIDYGALVFATEVGGEKHSVYEVGDIIIAINGKECRNSEAYAEYRDILGDVDYTATVLRANYIGELEKIDLDISAGESIIGVLPMCME